MSDSQIGILNKINEAIKSFDYSNDETENENEVLPIDCTYYNIKDLNAQNFNPLKQFSILHLNIYSVELHIEEFRIILQLLNLKFDFICITESKIRKYQDPKTDITIDGYKYPIGMSTEASKGGVLIYVKEGINCIPREDLNIHKSKELESYFIEVINVKAHHHHHHHRLDRGRTCVITPLHPSRSSIAIRRCSFWIPVSSTSWSMYVLAGLPLPLFPCVGSHSITSLITSFVAL